MKMQAKTLSLLLGLGLLANTQVFAQQDDPLLSETDQVVSSGQIDVDGIFKKKAQPTQADRIQALRRKLEKKHEQMMRKRVEDMRLEEERKLARKLENALNGQLQAMDQVSSASSSVQKQSVQKVEVKKPKATSAKATIQGGFLTISGQNTELDAAANISLELESMVHERVSVGIGVRHVSLEIEDVYGQNSNAQTTFFNPLLNNNFNQGQNADYKQLSFSIFSKGYLSVGTKIKPYIGLGLQYNRSKLSIGEESNNNVNNFYNIDDISSNYLAGSASIGADVQFSDQFSAGLNVKFESALTEGLKDLSYQSDNERRLKELALDIEEADVISVNAGVSFHF